ncbi:hypothetical protein [Bdellovibrio sp. HCB337]|uniref:hypothetical protein n=1 Tax=Bdellovibrio sp. HCB337 TaxID=3394358 RepID=UPI0039A6C083
MIKAALATITLLASTQALAKLDRSTTKPMVMPVGVSQGATDITTKDVEKIIPTDLQATNDMNKVAVRIADRSLQTWFNSAAVRNSALGRTADNVQQNLATDVTVKSDEPAAVEHKFSMQLLALQAMAKIQYTGWLNAVFNYDAKAAESMVELSEKIFNKDLFVNHTSSPREDVSTVGIKWGW